ncbi:MAG TPA: polyprenol monophosphomannose synthase [Candidatus Cloacimonadota bacterium]|nr:polyprenol monophosphomannose synthase [Candidatus Cloacimonadota bacterium]HQL15295.1 polyprenol monophosphomannose synthase [Candidatus Cloacimonadota bacterium]
MKVLVITPTYNEKENIERLIKAVLQLNDTIEILIVDDNSPDGTAGIVERVQQNEPRLHLIKRSGKLGLGSAYVTGFKYALQNGYDYILEMDADFSHNPNDIPRLLEAAQNYDLVIGSRYCEGINIVHWPIQRLLISYFASKYVRVITGMPIKDPTGGFKCFKRKVLESIDLDNIRSEGYAFQIEMNYKAWIKGFKLKEISIVFTERADGKSKMTKKIIYEAAWMVWKLKILAMLKAL